MVFNYLYSQFTSLSINQTGTNNDIGRVTGALIQQQIQVALSSTIYAHFFLLIQPVYTSSHTENWYNIIIIMWWYKNF